MKRHRRLSDWAGATVACALMLATDAASAAIWEWGCKGALGSEQIIFNRDRLVVISGKASPGKLDDFVHGGQFTAQAAHSAPAIVATYQPDESNDGLVTTLRFTGEGADRKFYPDRTVLAADRAQRASHCALPR